MHRRHTGATFDRMKHVTIRLADAEGVVLEDRTIEGEFATIIQCLAMLVGGPPSFSSPEELEALLLEGLAGEEIEADEAFWADLRKTIAEGS